jgi:hypothetical protein
LGRGFGT